MSNFAIGYSSKAYSPPTGPTINIENQDPACDLDYTANTARELNLKVGLSNSFGFGGTNGTVIFKRFD